MNYIFKWEKLVWKDYAVCDSKYMTSGGNIHSKKISSLRKEREEFNRWRTEDIHDGETTLYETAMVDMYIMHLSRPRSLMYKKSETGYANFENHLVGLRFQGGMQYLTKNVNIFPQN